MADLTISAGGVLKISGPTPRNGTFGETIAQGQPVYLSGSGTLYRTAATTAAAATSVGITLNSGSLNQPAQYANLGDINISATTVRGTPYCVSRNVGKIAPYSDLASTDNVFILGIAKDNSGTLSLVMATTSGGPIAI